MCETCSFQENEINTHAIKSIYQKINNSNIHLCKLPILLKWKWKGHAIVRRKSTCSLVKVFFSGLSMNIYILLWNIHTSVDLYSKNGFLRAISHRMRSLRYKMQCEDNFKQKISTIICLSRICQSNVNIASC